MQPYMVKVCYLSRYRNKRLFLGAHYLNGDKYDMSNIWSARLVQIFRSRTYKKNNQNIIVNKINYKILITYLDDRIVTTNRILFFN